MATVRPFDAMSMDRHREDDGAEQARLTAELAELRARAEAHADAAARTVARIHAAFLALGEAAREELESVELAHEAAVAALYEAAELEARAVLAGVDTDGTGPATEQADPLARS